MHRVSVLTSNFGLKCSAVLTSNILFTVINQDSIQPIIKESLTDNFAIPVTIKGVKIEKLNIR